jgi:hypothetical protein
VGGRKMAKIRRGHEETEADEKHMVRMLKKKTRPENKEREKKKQRKEEDR